MNSQELRHCGQNFAMPAPRNIDELKDRTLEQIFALKGKGVKVSGPKINEYLSDRDLTGPSHRNIMALSGTARC